MQDNRTSQVPPGQVPSEVVHPVSNTGVDVAVSEVWVGLHWLAGNREGSVPGRAHYELCALLGRPIHYWEFAAPMQGYLHAVEFGGCKVSWGPKETERDLAHFSMSGTALSSWVASGLIENLIGWLWGLREDGVRFTRTDTYREQVNGDLDIEELMSLCAEGRISTKAQEWRPIYGKRKIGEDSGDTPTLTIGDRSSDRYMRIYDKRDESRPKGVPRLLWRETQPKRIRVELESKDEMAEQVVTCIIDHGLERAATGSIARFVDFKQRAGSLRGRSKRKTFWKWAAFMGAVAKLEVPVFKVKKSVESTKRWIEESLAAMLRMVVEDEARCGRTWDVWLENIIAGARLKQRHYNMLDAAALVRAGGAYG